MNKQGKNNAIWITLIIAVAIVAVVLIGVVSDFNKGDTTVSADGIATLKVTPDKLSIDFNAQTEAKTAEEARDKNSEITDALITNIVKLGFNREDIQTENYNIQANYEWHNDGTRTLKGYIAYHTIKVRMSTSDTDKIGKVVDAGVDAGALVNYINFELSTELQNQYKTQALEQATKDAKTKAEAIATGLGKKLGDVKTVSSSNFDYYPWRAYDAAGLSAEAGAAAVKQAATSIQPGEREVTASVSITYELIQ